MGRWTEAWPGPVWALKRGEYNWERHFPPATANSKGRARRVYANARHIGHGDRTRPRASDMGRAGTMGSSSDDFGDSSD